jgi:hypothetical protein
LILQSGLYSAVLTAFVVESYQNLQPNQGERTSEILIQISRQLASLSNASIPNNSAADELRFQPELTAVASNFLWFSSLSLALCCAFLATFVQQWSRHFLHRTTITRTPSARAHIFSFLYFGLKQFRMHEIVDVIPFLLHLSLVLFFAGLVAFLHPINPTIQWLVSAFLILIICVYTALTVLPVLRLDSPYQTPLSPIAWRIWRHLRLGYRQSYLPEKASDPEDPEREDEYVEYPDPASLSGAVVAASLRDSLAKLD